MYGEKMKLKDDKRHLIIKGKEGKDYPVLNTQVTTKCGHKYMHTHYFVLIHRNAQYTHQYAHSDSVVSDNKWILKNVLKMRCLKNSFCAASVTACAFSTSEYYSILVIANYYSDDNVIFYYQ